MIVFAISKTGGHIYPAIALAQELSSETAFLGPQDSQVKRLVTDYGFSFFALPKASLNPLFWMIACVKSFFYLRKLRPQKLVGTGGLSMVPVVLMAVLLRIPIVLLEQNSLPGRATRFCQRFAKRVYSSFSESEAFLNSQKLRCLGNPVRKVFIDDEMGRVLKRYDLTEKRCIVLLGGSQGAHSLNDWIAEHYSFFLETDWHLIHITGRSYYEQKNYASNYHCIADRSDCPKVLIFPYLERMDIAYAYADLVISRAGATTIAELLAFQKPSILVPYPYAKDNHQLYNAESLSKRGMATICEQKDLSFETLSSHFEEYSREHSENLSSSVVSAREMIATDLLSWS